MTRRSSYLDIKQHVLAKIRSGTWRPGSLIPKERELADVFGCARMTVHRALRELADDGVVERRRRSGTRVALQMERKAIVEIPRVDREIEATGATYRYQRINRRVIRPGESLAARLNVSTKQAVLHLECLHHANDAPFQLEQRWINLAVVPEAKDEVFDKQPPNVWLLERKPWSNVEHVISAVAADSSEAAHLELSVGDALLVVERRTWIDAQIITYVRMMHPGSFYKLRAGGAGIPAGV